MADDSAWWYPAEESGDAWYEDWDTDWQGATTGANTSGGASTSYSNIFKGTSAGASSSSTTTEAGKAPHGGKTKGDKNGASTSYSSASKGYEQDSNKGYGYYGGYDYEKGGGYHSSDYQGHQKGYRGTSKGYNSYVGTGKDQHHGGAGKHAGSSSAGSSYKSYGSAAASAKGGCGSVAKGGNASTSWKGSSHNNYIYGHYGSSAAQYGGGSSSHHAGGQQHEYTSLYKSGAAASYSYHHKSMSKGGTSSYSTTTTGADTSGAHDAIENVAGTTGTDTSGAHDAIENVASGSATCAVGENKDGVATTEEQHDPDTSTTRTTSKPGATMERNAAHQQASSSQNPHNPQTNYPLCTSSPGPHSKSPCTSHGGPRIPGSSNMTGPTAAGSSKVTDTTTTPADNAPSTATDAGGPSVPHQQYNSLGSTAAISSKAAIAHPPLQNFELTPEELDSYIAASRTADEKFREFLKRTESTPCFSQIEREVTPESFAAARKTVVEKRPFGGFAMQLLYSKYVHYRRNLKKAENKSPSSKAENKEKNIGAVASSSPTAAAQPGGELKFALPWILPGRLGRYLIEAESLTKEEGQHLARPRTLPGPSPYEQQYVIPPDSIRWEDDGQQSWRWDPKKGAYALGRKLPITDKPVPAGYWFSRDWQPSSGGGHLPPIHENDVAGGEGGDIIGTSADGSAGINVMEAAAWVAAVQPFQHMNPFQHISQHEQCAYLVQRLTDLGAEQLYQWGQGRDIVELEFLTLTKEGLVDAHMPLAERDALLDSRTEQFGFRMLDRFEGSANLRQIRQTYRIRNVGTNPHELKLFQDLALSNAAIKDLVRHIKEEQTKSGALVLRNQTRITTRPHLIDAVLEQRSTMTAEELFLGKLRALVSVHTAVHVQEIESVWDAFFVPAGYESFAESLEEANLVADSVCLVVEKELSRVMTMTRGYLEEIPDSTTSADIEVGREGVWEVPAPVLVHHAPVQLVSPPSHVDYWTTSPPALHYSNELVAMSSGTEVEVGVEMV